MYKHQEIEKKWQAFWKENDTFACDTSDLKKSKCYILDMFPYPSGNGLHVGHPEGYTATDIYARMKRMQGYNVLHPMGWDAFGLPAEQYAIQTGHHPSTFTKQNINHFRKQIQALGFSYDWNREISTCDESYYKWTQWIFLKLYEKGLAYVDEIPVNWCPQLKTVLANEEIVDGVSERGGYPVVRKPMRQWVLKITEYAERLLADLDLCDWPTSTKEMQIHWIGKSVGANVTFQIQNSNKAFTVFTTRCDTLFGVTYCVMAPEFPYLNEIVSDQQRAAVEAYQKQCMHKSDLERSELSKVKTGVFTGAYAINPVNQKPIPIWISDYVLASYGSGAIMAVPAHDTRDYEFAKKFKIEMIEVIKGGDLKQEAFTKDGIHVNSDFLNGMDKTTAINTMLKWLKDHKCGESKTTYKLRDWLFSRQRYWGEPIPIIHLADGSVITHPINELPLQLPDTTEFHPSDNGESPLQNCKEWSQVEINGVKGQRESNTMPQWAGSCWYFLRYLDPHNADAIADKKLLDHWLPVDLYVGGAEHAVLHLLYARFWHKVLYDCGIVSQKEPFKKLFHQGMILGANNEKMSKSRGNVVNPDDIIISHGADALRIYEMFMGPLQASLPWNPSGLDGMRKWLERVWRLFHEMQKISKENDHHLDKIYHASVKKITHDIETLNFNTAVSQMMIFINDCYKAPSIYEEYAKGFIKMFACFAPHMGEELWESFGEANKGISYSPWPNYDEAYLIEEEIEIVVQVNGKYRGKLVINAESDEQSIQKEALQLATVKTQIINKTVRKIIVVKGKIVNIVVS